jgi:hypothetical protein
MFHAGPIKHVYACYCMCMASLNRRVQVLFDQAQYAALEAEAGAQRQSVAAVIREAVGTRLQSRKTTQSEALDRLFASADTDPDLGPIEWEAEKDAFERDPLLDIP